MQLKERDLIGWALAGASALCGVLAAYYGGGKGGRAQRRLWRLRHARRRVGIHGHAAPMTDEDLAALLAHVRKRRFQLVIPHDRHAQPRLEPAPRKAPPSRMRKLAAMGDHVLCRYVLDVHQWRRENSAPL